MMSNAKSTGSQKKLNALVSDLFKCHRCPLMIPPVVSGQPILSRVMLVGQAPGVKEGVLGRPFAWTAGKTLFKWFSSIGLPEEEFRRRVYMAAVCRCFPGKNPKGGDRVPNPEEVENCLKWMEEEVQILKPELILPAGKLAIQLFLEAPTLNEAVGKSFTCQVFGHETEIIPLPHPSGASTWHRMEPGKTLLQKALRLIQKHPAFAGLTRER